MYHVQVSDDTMSEAIQRAMDFAELNGLDNKSVVRLIDLIVDRSIASDSL